MSGHEEKLGELGIALPDVPKPAAAYIPARKVGNLVSCSGQVPCIAGRLVHTGKVGKEKTVREGYGAARICPLNCLAAVKDLVGSLLAKF